MAMVPKTLGALALMQWALPVNLAVTGLALVRSQVVPPAREVADVPRTVLVSGGKMTKALELARAFHRAGHRVVLVEQAKYRLTGHRFSRAVDRFYTVPAPDADGYAEALVDIVRREDVDVYVPVCSPLASYYDALAAPVLAPYCEVLHSDAETVRMLDDKYVFSATAASLGLSVPDHHRIDDPAQVDAFDFAASGTGTGTGTGYILKSIPYDPVNRMDLTPLPRPTRAETNRFARSKPISAQSPWILQGFVPGQEYCTHSTVRDGRVTAFACCPSSGFQINYAQVDKPEIEAWVRGFVEPLGLTGQVSFDFIETPEGELFAIECNPRTHSAITLFHDHPGFAAAYLDPDAPAVTPLPGTRPTYWLYHEVWRLLREPDRLTRLRVILAGRDAVFDRDDPLPFLMLHHVHLPWLLVRNLLALRNWVRIDANIGKLVEPGGD